MMKALKLYSYRDNIYLLPGHPNNAEFIRDTAGNLYRRKCDCSHSHCGHPMLTYEPVETSTVQVVTPGGEPEFEYWGSADPKCTIRPNNRVVYGSEEEAIEASNSQPAAWWIYRSWVSYLWQYPVVFVECIYCNGTEL